MRRNEESASFSVSALYFIFVSTWRNIRRSELVRAAPRSSHQLLPATSRRFLPLVARKKGGMGNLSSAPCLFKGVLLLRPTSPRFCCFPTALPRWCPHYPRRPFAPRISSSMARTPIEKGRRRRGNSCRYKGELKIVVPWKTFTGRSFAR